MKNQEKEEQYLKQKEKHDLLKDRKNKKNNTKDYHIALQEQMHETCKPATFRQASLHSKDDNVAVTMPHVWSTMQTEQVS